MKQKILIGLGVLAVVLLGGMFAAQAFSPHLYAGTVLQSSDLAPSMSGLSFADGTAVELEQHRDKVVLVYFGYTNCPDVCPTTLATAGTAIDGMSSGDADRVELMMISVDPERDTPDELDEYVGFFSERFRGVSGSRESIDQVATKYGVFYELGEGDVDSGYIVDHTATLLAIGTDGALRIVWPPTIGAKELRADIEEMLK